MNPDSPNLPADAPVAFEYYMLRLSRSAPADGLAGQVERLGTGEKRRFDSAEELVRLVALWTEPVPAGRAMS
jgi:hypothetical protein